MTTNDLTKSIDPRRGISYDMTQTPIRWGEIREKLAPQGEGIPAIDLVDHELTLLRMKQFPSRFDNQEYAYWVVFYDETDQKMVNTVLGGSACIEVFDALIEAGLEQPVLFILRWNEGGAYSGYYTLE